MPTINDLIKDTEFRTKLAQSFIPHSKSLANAWSTPENKGDKQVQ